MKKHKITRKKEEKRLRQNLQNFFAKQGEKSALMGRLHDEKPTGKID